MYVVLADTPEILEPNMNEFVAADESKLFVPPTTVEYCPDIVLFLPPTIDEYLA